MTKQVASGHIAAELLHLSRMELSRRTEGRDRPPTVISPSILSSDFARWAGGAGGCHLLPLPVLLKPAKCLPGQHDVVQ